MPNRPWYLHLVCALLALAFLAAGTAKLMGAPQLVEAFHHFGYPDWFRLFIGAAEVSGAVGLFIRGLSRWAALGLAVIMIGAVGSHLTNDPLNAAIPAATLLGLLVLVLWRDRSSVASHASEADRAAADRLAE